MEKTIEKFQFIFLVAGIGFFVLAFVVTSIVSLLWNLLAHGQSTVDWATSFRFGIVLGILLPWMTARGKKRQ